ncbi:MAG: restriction endonuclease subunit S [Phycisphaerales bacterium]
MPRSPPTCGTLGMPGELRETIYGDFAADFVEERLATLCDPDVGIQTGPFGSQLHQEDYLPVGTPIITVEHLGENRITHEGSPRVSDADRSRLSRYLLREGDIVFSRVGSVDRRALVRHAEDGWLFSGRCLRVRPNTEKIDASYLSYFFGLPAFREHIRAIAVGATMPSLNTAILSDVLVPHPPGIPEQRAIAHILGTLDDKIELNRRMNETLEAMARALFKSWFVDFDPVRAKAEGRDPGLPKHLADLFPDSFVDSELGEIPRGWGVARFTDTIEILGGGTPRTSVAEYWGGDIPWFSVVDAPTDSEVWVLDTEKKVTHAGVENSSTRVLPVRTTIISARGTVGRVALVGAPMAMNQSCYGLKGLAGTQGFFNYYSTRELVVRLQQHAHGSVFDTITRDTLAGVFVVVPPSGLVVHFEKGVAPGLGRIRAGLLEASSLAALRDTLLPKLISGELRVKDAERLLKAVSA